MLVWRLRIIVDMSPNRHAIIKAAFNGGRQGDKDNYSGAENVMVLKGGWIIYPVGVHN